MTDKIKELEKNIKIETNNNPDITYKHISFFNHELAIIFSESLCSSESINDFILEFLEEKQRYQKPNEKDILKYLENNIPIHKLSKTSDYEYILYLLFSGYAIIHIRGIDSVLALEVKMLLNSPVSFAQTETVIKGPRDAFTENYQTNLGLIKKRLKTEKLCLEEMNIGSISKTKIGILYVEGIVNNNLVNSLKEKLNKINIDSITYTNYIAELIQKENKNVFPTSIATERPDLVSMHLLQGKVVILVENSQLVLILPALFSELFHSPEDYYQKPMNANYTRVIRLLAFLITILTPALYVAITTYNHEAIPAKLLISLSNQRAGVPLPTILEAILMLITFEIIKETDTRTPSVIGSSLSIVGALVLGDAAVNAGIVSPIMVIVIAVTSISGFIVSFFDVVNGIRWWRLIFLIFAAIAGILGIFVSFLLFIINLSSVEVLGIPYLTPVVPLNKKDLGDNVFVSNKSKFFKRYSFLTKNIIKGKE